MDVAEISAAGQACIPVSAALLMAKNANGHPESLVGRAGKASIQAQASIESLCQDIAPGALEGIQGNGRT